MRNGQSTIIVKPYSVIVVAYAKQCFLAIVYQIWRRAVNEQGRLRSEGQEKLKKMAEIQKYPERIKFDVSPARMSMQSYGEQCRIVVCGIQRNDGHEHFFNISLPTPRDAIPRQPYQLQVTGISID